MPATQRAAARPVVFLRAAGGVAEVGGPWRLDVYTDVGGLYNRTRTRQLRPRSPGKAPHGPVGLRHRLDRTATIRRPRGSPEALGAILLPDGRAGARPAAGPGPAGGRRGGRRAQRVRHLLPPRRGGPLPRPARPRRPVAAAVH